MMGWMMQNFLVCGVLSGLVWGVCRWEKLGPVMRHALWVVVLVKLVMPGVVAWPWAVREEVAVERGVSDVGRAGAFETLRSWLSFGERDGRAAASGGMQAKAEAQAQNNSEAMAGAAAVKTATENIVAGTPGATAARVSGEWNWTRQRVIGVAGVIWLVGGLGFALLQLWRIGWMAWRVRRGEKENKALERAIGEEARRMGMRGIPVRVLRGLEGPYVWTVFRPVLLWPVEMTGVGAAERALMVHELAHVRRRDHWVGWVQLLAGGVWWWNPVYWYVCGKLREEAELACDGWVVEIFPKGRRVYAEALLGVCERMRNNRAPALAMGVNSGGKRILERRLMMIMREKVALRMSWMGLIGVVLVGLAAMPAWSQRAAGADGEAKGKPFTVSKETTVITSPLRADGTPDYVRAINEKYGAGVTPENNGAVIWLEVAGTRVKDGMVAKIEHDEVFRRLGARETQEGEQVWETYDAYLTRKMGKTPSDDGSLEQIQATKEMRAEKDHPNLAEYLAFEKPLMDRMAASAARPRWWFPMVSHDGRNLLAVLLPSLGNMRDVANAFCSRAALRAGAGDFAGFVQDIVTTKRLAAHVAEGPTVIEKLVGNAVDSLADRTVALVARSGKLTVTQCETLLTELGRLPKKPGMIDAMDMMERWTQLDMLIVGATDHEEFAKMMGTAVEKKEIAGKVGTIEWDSLNWDVVLKKVNTTMDRLVNGMRAPGLKESRQAGLELDNQTEKWVEELTATPDLKMQPGESRDAYSERIGQMFMGVLMPSLGRADELVRRGVMFGEMAQVMVGAAEVKAKTGVWPGKLEDLVPGVMKEIPRDIYSEKGRAAVRYKLAADGPLVYSVGPNGRDDGGERGTGEKDDIPAGW